MTELKVGDKVKVKEGWYIGYTLNSRYNLPRTPGIVVESGGYVIIDYDGKLSPPVNPDGFDLISTHIPLYSEEQAVSFLREKGYKVEEPPKPLSGKIVVYKSHNLEALFMKTKEEWDQDCLIASWRASRTIVAIIDWTEGEGL